MGQVLTIDTPLIIDINVFSALILVVLWISTRRQSSKQNTRYRLYFLLLISTLAMLVLDSLAWSVDGQTGNFWVVANWLLNGLLLTFTPLVSALWLMYTDYQVFTSRERLKKAARVLAFPLLANAILTIASPFFDFYYRIDSAGVYHQSSLAAIFLVIAISPAFYAEMLVLLNRSRLGSQEYAAMLFFPLISMAAGIVQFNFDDYPLVWNGITLALVAVYVNIQDQLAHTDYLTGVYNRRQADDYLRQKIRATEQGRGFSGMLLDIDDFKQINDRYGHAEGDACLSTLVQLLRTTLRRDDFLARVGGDEFLVILDISTHDELNRARKRIHDSLRKHNLQSGKMYQISISMGADVYNIRHGNGRTAFLKHLDRLMYEDKNARKTERALYQESRRRFEERQGHN